MTMKLQQSQKLSQTERIYITGFIENLGKTVTNRWVIKVNTKKDTIKVYSLTETEYDIEFKSLVCYEGNPIKNES